MIATQENVAPNVREENIDVFVTDTVDVHVEPRVKNPTVASTSVDVVYDDEWYDKLFDDLNNHVFDKGVQDVVVKIVDALIRDICDVHKDVQFDFDFEECNSDGEGFKGDDEPDLMPFRPRKKGNEPKETE